MTTSMLRPELDDLRTRVAGTVTGRGDPGYDAARAVWNGMVDRRPWAVVRAADVRDVAPTVAYVREHGLDLAVPGGGHHVADNGAVDDGVVLDGNRPSTRSSPRACGRTGATPPSTGWTTR